MKMRREKKEERYDLLSMMLNCEGLTDQEVKANTFIFFIAGHETVIQFSLQLTVNRLLLHFTGQFITWH
jgi:cytochrome P450